MATTTSGSCKLFHCFGQKDSLGFDLRSKTKNYVLMNHISLRQPNVDIILKEVVPDPKSTTIVLKKASSKTKKIGKRYRMHELKIYYMLRTLNKPASLVVRCASM